MSLTAGRHAGLLVPLFSMPSARSWGIGEIADIPLMAAWLRGADQDLLQLLPLNEMAVHQRSPYSAMAAMAIDPVYISVHEQEDFLAIGGEAAMDGRWQRRLRQVRQSPAIDYAGVRALKGQALRAAFARFRAADWAPGRARGDGFRRWSDEQSWWLSDYALFRAIHAHEHERPWTEWPEPLRAREDEALARARAALSDEILYREWLQWVADAQWRRAREQAGPVSLLGDLPFMVDADSADVWARAGAFDLDASVGAPPDAFSRTGQNWGLPAYRWDVMAGRGYDWLRDRARRAAALYDAYRMDHIVGFYRTYVFPRDGSPAFFTPAGEDAQLRLGEAVLAVLSGAGARVVAEDLGTVPDFVRESLARLGVPGYKVFRWERHWHTEGQPFRDPARYETVSVAASGTHDTEPVAAWWDGLELAEKENALSAPGVAELFARTGETGERFTAALRDVLLEVLYASGSDLLLIPVQDLFGWRDRINVPASLAPENWTWRLPWPVDALQERAETRERAEALRRWTSRYDRALARPARQ